MLPILSPSFSELAQRPINYTRAHYGIKNDAFVFLFSWDFFSSWQRKNPMAVLKAYAAAFGNENVFQEKKHADLPKPLLVLKSINVHTLDGNRIWAEMKAFVAAQPQLRNVVFLENHMTAAETVDLFKHANAYVSLHRSEGKTSAMHVHSYDQSRAVFFLEKHMPVMEPVDLFNHANKIVHPLTLTHSLTHTCTCIPWIC